MHARPRTLLAGVAAAGAAVLLAGCEKPTPYVTVTAAGNSVHAEASTYAVNGNLARYPRAVPVVPVKSGQLVGVDVDRSIAKGQWVVSLDDPQTNSPVPFATGENSHFESFYAPQLAAQRGGGTRDLTLRVSVTRSETGRTDDRAGQWLFTLRVSA